MIFFVSTLIFIIAVVVSSIKKFKTYFNPWFLFLCTDVALLHVLSIFSANALGLIDDQGWMRDLLFASSLYILGYGLAFFVSSIGFQVAAKSLMNLIPDVQATFKIGACTFVLFGISFLTLVVIGEGGLLWFTDPRHAYLNFRGATGDGGLYVLAQWTLMLSAIVNLNLWSWRRVGFFVMLLCHCGFAYLMGSKQILLIILIYAVFVTDYKFGFVRLYHFIGIGLLAAVVFLIMLGANDGVNSVVYAGLYFSEYSVNTSRIFDLNVTSSFYPGEILLSNYWTYIPRAFVDSKPFEYGQVLINSILFPGAAERGQTPGLLYWSSWFVDFGFIGVFFYGLMRGIIDNSIFRIICNYKSSPIKVAFIFSASVMPVFLFAPLPYLFIFLLLISGSLRLIKRRSKISNIDFINRKYVVN